ncbi:MAG: NAD(P)H-hydrate dehydratase [Chitinophagaceae bacterium]
MLILSPDQIKQWDQYTIEHEPIASIDLMERAVLKCLNWLEIAGYCQQPFVIYCGKGNNGGDGLALARMLSLTQLSVKVFILEFDYKGSVNFQENLTRLQQTPVEISFIQNEDSLQPLPASAIVIDALFGSGLNRQLDAVPTRLIEHINKSGNEVIAIDLPSGMFAHASSKGGAVIEASHTLSFQCYKLAFLLPENEANFGEIHILDIGLHPVFLQSVQTEMTLIDESFISAIYKPRKAFSHKGTFGHALVVAGSFGKMGAAVLAAKACLRTGVGLLTCIIPACGYNIMQSSVPEAMAITDIGDRYITNLEVDLFKYDVIGIGPGLGTAAQTSESMSRLLSSMKSAMVLDADALNILAAKKELLNNLSPFSVITPHPKEFERLFGASNNDVERLHLAISKAKELQVIIVLKGHHSFIAMPGGKGYFNSTGNAGMATGGSGDVLTGIITGLVAQGYTSQEASLLGVYLHGMAGDFAADLGSEEALIASDIVACLGDAFKKIQSFKPAAG